MATQRSPSPSSDAPLDSAPLLGGVGRRRGGCSGRLSGARRGAEPSVLVREAAAEQLEERQADWAYSRPVAALDFLWNLAFILVSTVVLVLSHDESSSMLLCFWIAGYAAQESRRACSAIRVPRASQAMMRSVRVSGTGSAGSRRSDDPRGSGELSRFFVATSTASGGGGRGISYLDAFRSCFVPPEVRSPENSMSDESHPSQQPPKVIIGDQQ